MIARRDELDPSVAEQKVVETLRLVAAAKRAVGGEAATALVTEPRARYLTRSALARVWLTDDFEARHGPEDIPNDSPRLRQARMDPRLSHPEIVSICQLVAKPADVKDPKDFEAITNDPAWRERARARFEPAAEHVQRYVPADRPDTCELMRNAMVFETETAEGIQLKVETGGFDLDACAKQADDGTCAQFRFASEWVNQVRGAPTHKYLPAFETRFGSHLVYIDTIVPASEPDDAELRKIVHPQWQRETFATYLEELREYKAVKIQFDDPES